MIDPPTGRTTDAPAAPEMDLEDLAQQVDQAMAQVQKLEGPARAAALDLKRAIEAFHRLGLTRIVQRLKADPRGKELLFELVDEPSVYALFAMHGIVRADVTTQAARVLEMVRPYMRSHGGDVELVRVEGDTAFVRLHGACNGCSLSAVTLRESVQEALTTHVPQIQRVEVVPDDPVSGLILPEEIPVHGPGVGTHAGWIQGPSVEAVSPGVPYRMDVEGVSILILNLDNQFYAYRNQCAHQGLPLDGGVLDPEACVLTCPWHGFRFDVTTGECLTAPQAQLEPFPLRIQDGRIWVRPT